MAGTSLLAATAPHPTTSAATTLILPRNFDYLEHPLGYDYARGVMAHPDCPCQPKFTFLWNRRCMHGVEDRVVNHWGDYQVRRACRRDHCERCRAQVIRNAN